MCFGSTLTILGAVDISRTTYLDLLETGLEVPAVFGIVGGLDSPQ
jgi:hypothetical protein